MIHPSSFLSARELLNQIVDSLEVKHDGNQLEQPCDCEYMSLLTEAADPCPFHLVNGGDYLSWVNKYGYYFSACRLMQTAFICLESKPLTNLLSMVSLATGIPKTDLFSLHVCRSDFGALNRGLTELYIANPLFCELPRLDLNELIALIRHLKKNEDVETVVIDALHRVRIDAERLATRTEQGLISSVLKSTAKVGKLRIVAGFYDPDVEFPDIHGDTVLYCGSLQKAGPPQRQAAITQRATATLKTIWSDIRTSMCRIARFKRSLHSHSH